MSDKGKGTAKYQVRAKELSASELTGDISKEQDFVKTIPDQLARDLSETNPLVRGVRSINDKTKPKNGAAR